MTEERYATICPASEDMLNIWEVDSDGRHKVVERNQPISGAGDLPIWEFEVETTDIVNSQANAGNHPIVDASGSPLWPGARVNYALHARVINVYKGFGVIGSFDLYGGASLKTDNPEPRRVDRDAWAMDTNHYWSGSTYRHDGELASFRVMEHKVGSPHHLGVFETWLCLADDPRTVCALKYEPGAAPRAMKP